MLDVVSVLSTFFLFLYNILRGISSTTTGTTVVWGTLSCTLPLTLPHSTPILIVTQCHPSPKEVFAYLKATMFVFLKVWYKALFAMRNEVLATDKRIFDTPIDTLLSKPSRTIKLFIDQNIPIIKHSIRQQRTLISRQHHDFASYFQITPSDRPQHNTRVTQNN